MSELASHAHLSKGNIARNTPPDIIHDGPDCGRALVVDCCYLDQSVKGARPILVAVMDSANQLILAGAVATKATMVASVSHALKEAIATDPAALRGVPVECDFLDPAELHSLLSTGAGFARPVSGRSSRNTRGWAERRLRAAAMAINGAD